MKVQHIPHRVHFVGIGGIGMSSLAQWLLARGYQVSGSDRQNSEIVDILRKKGAKIAIGHSADNVTDVQLVVRTSAVSLDNVEVARAVANGIPVMLREELLGIIFNSYATRVAVCGTHGKTTVTAMIHHILKENNIAHTCFLGGLYQGENFSDGGDIVVAEACEYNRSFLHLSPTICCCLNAEYDHPDCF
ncbi:MAG: UDP-N-acetylmuramate--L-alanine ligase, partial [Clostridia bacterium]|nr:UDP-N-acetylmuramate--L-alanine ligase [Clostridia bacterium]